MEAGAGDRPARAAAPRTPDRDLKVVPGVEVVPVDRPARAAPAAPSASGEGAGTEVSQELALQGAQQARPAREAWRAAPAPVAAAAVGLALAEAGLAAAVGLAA